MGKDRIDDDDVVFLRVPPSAGWFEPPDRATTANFKLDTRRGDQGLSVYRKSVVTAQDVLNRPEAIAGSLIAQARVGAIRELRNGLDEALLLDVVAVDDESNPGHAEIRGPKLGKLSSAASKALRDLFQLS